MRNLLITAASLTLFVNTVVSDDTTPKPGDAPPAGVVAKFVSGAWGKDNKTVCPVLVDGDEIKVAIFARDSGDRVMELVKALDPIIGSNQKLLHSFLFVTHENNPTPSEEEWNQQLENLRQQVVGYKISHIAAGLMIRHSENSIRIRPQVGVFQSGDVVVMLIHPDSRNQRVIGYARSLRAAELEEAMIAQIRQEIGQSISQYAPHPSP